ncbi:MAG: NAD(+) synthase [Nanoarchaeota archaeon]
MTLDTTIRKAYFPHGAAQAASELMDSILSWTAGTGAAGGVVGLSGGIDSTTVAYLCKFAFDAYNAQEQKSPLALHGLVLPSQANAVADAHDGTRVAELLQIPYKVIPIEPIADKYVEALPDSLEQQFDRGNLYSEIRATVLSRYGAARNLRIMGTGNRDEDYVLGYFTKRGDGAVDNNVLGNLPKRLVRDLARHLGVPADLVGRVSTAGLWEGQTDEKELGYRYAQAEIIQNGYDEGLTAQEIVAVTGFDPRIVGDVRNRHLNTAHKRQLPPVGQLTLAYGENNA